MIIKKENRLRHENSPKCIAYEYLHNDKDINVAQIEIDGRYPDIGQVTNKKVKELIFVVEGNGRIVIDNKEDKITEGDAVLILPNQKYSIEGKLKLVISCTPAWSPEQHEIVNKKT